MAGSAAGRIIEIHGTIREVACLECTYRAPMKEVLQRLESGEGILPALRVMGF